MQTLSDSPSKCTSSLLSDLAMLKSAARQSHCGLLVTLQPCFYAESLVARAMHIADGVVSLASIESSSDVCAYISEPSTVSCLLQIKKEPGIFGVSCILMVVSVYYCV